jgi:uncharacterized protein YndB with AHSA1/START domain
VDIMPDDPLEERPSLSITRYYNASPEKMWRAWTDLEAMKEWWKPDDTYSPVVTEADVRVGGRFHVRMISPEGKEHDVSGVYLEVVPNRKLVFTWVGKETSERETLVTVILRPSGSGTELELRHEQFVDREDRDSHQAGWSGCLTVLEHFLAS